MAHPDHLVLSKCAEAHRSQINLKKHFLHILKMKSLL